MCLVRSVWGLLAFGLWTLVVALFAGFSFDNFILNIDHLHVIRASLVIGLELLGLDS